LGIPAHERNLEVYDVMTADEAFMTGTPFCILPVTSLNGAAIGAGRMGAVTGRLLDAWGANVGVNISAQIKAWAAAAGPRTTAAPSPYAFKTR
jgi:branched-chain amino acid aminotransferase